MNFTSTAAAIVLLLTLLPFLLAAGGAVVLFHRWRGVSSLIFIALWGILAAVLPGFAVGLSRGVGGRIIAGGLVGLIGVRVFRRLVWFAGGLVLVFVLLATAVVVVAGVVGLLLRPELGVFPGLEELLDEGLRLNVPGDDYLLQLGVDGSLIDA